MIKDIKKGKGRKKEKWKKDEWTKEIKNKRKKEKGTKKRRVKKQQKKEKRQTDRQKHLLAKWRTMQLCSALNSQIIPTFLSRPTINFLIQVF